MSDGEFKKVVYRRKFGKKLRNKNSVSSGHIDFEEEYSSDDLIRTVLKAVVNLQKSPYKQVFFDGLLKSLNKLNLKTITEIICYGLGSFALSNSSKYQLAILLILKNQYNCIVSIYDPVFTVTEINVLKILKFNVISLNEEGKRKISNDGSTLVFMPHCTSHLLNNFLYYNWDIKLKTCVFFCNSWSQVFNQNPLNSLLDIENYIIRLHPYIIEIKLNNNFEFIETFSEVSFHILSNLEKFPLNFWLEKQEPVYKDSSCEFLTKSSIKL